jgi:signal transduction histidine kinase
VPGLSAELETTVYRLVQESLTNVAKHARASRVRVGVAQRGHELEIEIADDGRGFDTTATTMGFGVAGMRERVYLAGGRLEISSGGGGTIVTVRLPVAHAGP